MSQARPVNTSSFYIDLLFIYLFFSHCHFTLDMKTLVDQKYWDYSYFIPRGDTRDHVRSVQYICTHPICGGLGEGGRISFPMYDPVLKQPKGSRSAPIYDPSIKYRLPKGERFRELLFYNIILQKNDKGYHGGRPNKCFTITPN